MTEKENGPGRKWWQNPATLTAIATLITAIGTLVGAVLGHGNGPA